MLFSVFSVFSVVQINRAGTTVGLRSPNGAPRAFWPSMGFTTTRSPATDRRPETVGHPRPTPGATGRASAWRKSDSDNRLTGAGTAGATLARTGFEGRFLFVLGVASLITGIALNLMSFYGKRTPRRRTPLL